MNLSVDTCQKVANLFMDIRKNRNPTSLAELQLLIEEGNILAQAIRLLLYARGCGLPKSWPKVRQAAFECLPFLEQVCKLDEDHPALACSLFILAECYCYGYGVDYDMNKVFALISRATSIGFAPAMDHLAWIYDYGVEVVPVDKTKAYELYCQAADAGYIFAATNVAACKLYGTGTKKDEVAGIVQYINLAEQHSSFEAIRTLGDCYSNGNGVEEDVHEATKWYAKGAELGDCYCQHCIAWCYYEGEGVEQDYDQAVGWYQKAVQQNYLPSKVRLAEAYIDGVGSLDVDHGAAYRLLVTVVDEEIDQDSNPDTKAYAEACMFLGELFLRGHGGCEINEPLALRYLARTVPQLENINFSRSSDLFFKVACKHNHYPLITALMTTSELDFAALLCAESLKNYTHVAAEHGLSVIVSYKAELPFELLHELDAYVTIEDSEEEYMDNECLESLSSETLRVLFESGELMSLMDPTVESEWDAEMVANLHAVNEVMESATI